MAMDITTLNEILAFVESEYLVDSLIVDSGQRKVFLAKKDGTADKFVLKICPLIPIAVARIQREIKILSELKSHYFPKFYFQFFVTDEVLEYFFDKFDPKTQQVRIAELREMNIRPFMVTVEEYIDHVPWSTCGQKLKDEKQIVEFLLHLFSGLNLLWEKKIVHRDLKPENILVRSDLTPVIIDLGIAKSMSEGTAQLTNPAFFSPCTPQFAALEQLTNNKAEVTYKTDQFSVGVISFLILTGLFPYGSLQEVGLEGLAQNIFKADLLDFRKHNTDASDGLMEFVKKLLQVHPYQRFRTLEEIVEALNKIKGGL